MASPGNQHGSNCIDTPSFPINYSNGLFIAHELN